MTRLPDPHTNNGDPTPTGGPDNPGTRRGGNRGNGAADTTNGADAVGARVVAGLAREVDALRRAVRKNADLPARLTELANTVTALANEINIRNQPPTGAAVSWLDRHDIPDPPPPEAGTDGEEVAPSAAEVLGELIGWVRRIFLRYHDGAAALPECWLYHPCIVEELLWLMSAWQLAYRHDSATVDLAADWHDRYRPGVVRRVRAYAGNCSLAEHTHPEPGPGEVGVLGAEQAAQLAAAWISGDPAPAPTAQHLAEAAARWRHGSRR